MPYPKHILIAQDSLYLIAIASELSHQPGVTVTNAADIHDPFTLATPPDVILVEKDSDLSAALAFIQAYPHSPVLAFDGQAHTVTTLSGKQTSLNTLPDLLKIIEQNTQ